MQQSEDSLFFLSLSFKLRSDCRRGYYIKSTLKVLFYFKRFKKIQKVLLNSMYIMKEEEYDAVGIPTASNL